jgi:hypothetical protein|tara:strand:+ start:411 stop:566 length:156 start_codon:yes stop_codon:yes gene_type:complete
LAAASPNIDITTDGGRGVNVWRFLALDMAPVLVLIGLILFVFKKVTRGGAI